MSRVETSESALQSANALFVDENFEEALKNYNLALELDSNNVEGLIKRSTCYHKLNKFTESLADAQAAINLQSNNPRAYLRKGIALFSLEEYESAKTAFEKGKQLEPENSSFRTWERKCDAELELENKSSSSTSKPQQTPPPQTTQNVTTPTTTSTPATTAPAPASKIRYEWYQTATDVYVSVFIKNLKKEDTVIDVQPKSLNVSAKLSDTNTEYQLDIDLCDEVIPQQSSTSYLPTKAEIKLKKAKPVRWKSLEGTGTATGTTSWDSISKPTSTPAAHQPKKNWDKIIAEEMADEKPEGEEALNKVFQDIYSNGSEDQKKAMMKSFMESGGTVLSTNWDEVGKAPVKGSPPEGMEMHKWNEL